MSRSSRGDAPGEPTSRGASSDAAAAAPGGASKLMGVLAVVAAVGVLAGGWLLSREQEFTVIVVSLDTTRPDHLSAYGYDRDTTPNLARLVREGTVFTEARSSSSWTLPSHMSLFTGLPADLHNVTYDFHELDAGRRTMGEIFKEADYRTVGLFTAPYVHGTYGFDRGMDFYEAMTRAPMIHDMPPPDPMRPEQAKSQATLREFYSHQEVTSGYVADRARFILKKRARARNLLFLHFFDPHYDYYPPPKVAQHFLDPDYDGPVTGEGITGRTDIIHPDMPEADRRQLLSLYDAEIRFVDNQLGHVIKTLEEEGKLGKTLVVITGDHGEEFFEDGRIGHRMGLRDEVLRIPLIVWGPGLVPEGQVIDEPVALYDVLPTVMDYAGLPSDPDIYGRSLRPLIDGDGLPARPTSSALTFLHVDAPPYYTRHDAVVHDGMKYLRRMKVPWSKDDPTRLDNPPDLDSAEIAVYDLRNDPGEKQNLYAERASDPRVAGIVREFDAEQSRQREALEGFQPLSSGARANVTFDSITEQLRQTGYIDTALPSDEADPEPPAADGD